MGEAGVEGYLVAGELVAEAVTNLDGTGGAGDVVCLGTGDLATGTGTTVAFASFEDVEADWAAGCTVGEKI